MNKSALDVLDLVQTATLLTVAIAIFYALYLVRRAFNEGAALLRENLEATKHLEQRLNEARGGHSDVVRDWVGVAWQHIQKIELRLDALEKGEPPPPGTRPTDPPYGNPGGAASS